MRDPEVLINSGKNTLFLEAEAIKQAAERLDDSFLQALNAIFDCRGRVVVTGLGKSGHIGRKIAATFASTGTPSLFLHPAEALHGDLGMITEKDILLAVAYSGQTREVDEVSRFARRLGVCVIALTGKLDSSLAKLAHIVLDGSVRAEACPLAVAPTCSSSVALAMGDALAVALMHARGFRIEDFAKYHPGGQLGRKLSLVKDLMRQQTELRFVNADSSFAEVLDCLTSPNFGIVPVRDQNLQLIGCVTDGDLRRAIKSFGDKAIGMHAGDFMSANPEVICDDVLAQDALSIMEQKKITSLFVVDRMRADRMVLGLIRMHDLIEAKII